MSEVSLATNVADAIARIVAIQKLILTDSSAYKAPTQRDSSGNPFWTNFVRPNGNEVQATGTGNYQVTFTVDMTLHYAGNTEGDNGVVESALMHTAIPLTLQYFLERPLLQHQAGQDGVNSMNEISISTTGRRTLPDKMVGTSFALTLPFDVRLDDAY